MASAGCPRLVIGKVLNHAEPGVTAVYDRHTYDAEKREALQIWARSLRALVDVDGAGGDRSSVTDDSQEPLRASAGTVTRSQIREIARTKMPDLNAASEETAMRSVEGTARSMGIQVVEG